MDLGIDGLADKVMPAAPGVPEGVPVYVRIGGKVYPRRAFSDMVLVCMEELLTRIIQTSRSPQTVLRRIAVLKEHPNTRRVVWEEAFRRVVEQVKPVTSLGEDGGAYHVLDLDAALQKRKSGL